MGEIIGEGVEKESKSSKIVCLPTLGAPKATWKFMASSWYNSAAARAPL
jgi:hypothetical protein